MRDRPLTLNRVTLDLEGLNVPLVDAPHAATTGAILQDLSLAILSNDNFTSYSRAKIHYANREQKFEQVQYSWKAVTDSVGWLQSQGIIEDQRAKPGTGAKRQSRMRLQPYFAAKAMNLFSAGRPAQRIHLLEMRDAEKQPTPFTFPKTMVEEMAWFADYLKQVPLTHESAVGNTLVLPALGESVSRRILDVRAVEPVRIFNNETIEQGGRFYHLWHLYLTKSERAAIRIGGERTLEPDYDSLHPRMAYAEQGIDMEGDPYSLPGWERPLAKEALNTLINAKTRNAAIASLTDPRKRKPCWAFKGPGAKERASALIDSLTNKHAPIASYFGSCSGLRLQRIDSDLLLAVQKEMARQNLWGLPLHDAIICPESHCAQVSEIMNSAFTNLFPSVKFRSSVVSYET